MKKLKLCHCVVFVFFRWDYNWDYPECTGYRAHFCEPATKNGSVVIIMEAKGTHASWF